MKDESTTDSKPQVKEEIDNKIIIRILKYIETAMNKAFLLFWGLIITGISIVLLLMHLFLPSIKMDPIALSLTFLVLLPFLLPLLKNYLSSITLFGNKLDFLKKEVEEQKELIKLLYEALKRNLTIHELHHLEELESKEQLPNYKYSDFLQTEMIRLCQHKFVEEKKDYAVWKMKETGDKGFNFKEYFSITDDGKEYLESLRTLKKRIEKW